MIKYESYDFFYGYLVLIKIDMNNNDDIKLYFNNWIGQIYFLYKLLAIIPCHLTIFNFFKLKIFR